MLLLLKIEFIWYDACASPAFSPARLAMCLAYEACERERQRLTR